MNLRYSFFLWLLSLFYKHLWSHHYTRPRGRRDDVFVHSLQKGREIAQSHERGSYEDPNRNGLFIFLSPLLVYYFYKHTQEAVKLFVILVVLGLLSLLVYKVLKYLLIGPRTKTKA